MDDQTNTAGGSLGWIDPNNYPIQEFGAVIGQIVPNECAGPVRSEYGYHLLWIEATKPGGPPSLVKHWNQVEALALNKKKSDWFNAWVSGPVKTFILTFSINSFFQLFSTILSTIVSFEEKRTPKLLFIAKPLFFQQKDCGFPHQAPDDLSSLKVISV